MPLIRERADILDLFGHLPFHSDSKPDSDFENPSVMFASNDTSTAGPPSPNNNTNPFSFKIDLQDKIRNTLFLKATKGLSDDDKISLSIKTAQSFKEEVDRAAADFCWGSVCSNIRDSSGNSKDILVDYKDLTLTNLKNHANITWNCTTGDNNISTPAVRLTKPKQRRRIFCTMMSKWIRKS